MAATVSSNNHGFTLIELLVAMVILTVGLLALLQTVNVAIVSNMNNQLRGEGVSVGDLRMTSILQKPFDLISTTTNVSVEPRRINNGFRNYSVTVVGSGIAGSSPDFTTKLVDITVRWNYKGVRYNHEFSTLVSKLQQ